MVQPKRITLTDTLSPKSLAIALLIKDKSLRDPVLEKLINEMGSPNTEVAVKVSQPFLLLNK